MVVYSFFGSDDEYKKSRSREVSEGWMAITWTVTSMLVFLVMGFSFQVYGRMIQGVKITIGCMVCLGLSGVYLIDRHYYLAFRATNGLLTHKRVTYDSVVSIIV